VDSPGSQGHLFDRAEISVGGTAFSILGDITPERRQSRPTWFGRLFGARPGHTIIVLPSKDFDPLKKEFLSFLRLSIPNPWLATQSVLDYLKRIGFNIRLQGERIGTNEPTWSLQFLFSGCAGMAEVSSQIAWHWTEIWYHIEGETIPEKYLIPNGFMPSGAEMTEEPPLTFLPLDELGYACFDPDGFEIVGSESIQTHFDIDETAAMILGEEETTLRKSLEANLVSRMADGECRCQLCMPDLDLSFQKELSLRGN